MVSLEISTEKTNNNIAISFFSLPYFCLDTKVPKNQGKKNAARSAKQLSGSNKTRKRQAVLQEPLSEWSFTAPPPLLFAGPTHVLRGRCYGNYPELLFDFSLFLFLSDNNKLKLFVIVGKLVKHCRRSKFPFRGAEGVAFGDRTILKISQLLCVAEGRGR